MPQIDYEKCTGCGICVGVCSCQAIVFEGTKVVVKKAHRCDTCTRWCGNCELVCPNDAISCPFEIVINS
ncbi:MAG: 4Fe-4S binding protein [Dehalococcoidales bacterium]|nr:4Fe-4S binding protein [Dehalococcoidales bacterium]